MGFSNQQEVSPKAVETRREGGRYRDGARFQPRLAAIEEYDEMTFVVETGPNKTVESFLSKNLV
jgi:hypothetical protein